MKLMQYQRPGLAWPTFGRLASLQDELDRLFESPLTGWAPALDVHEDKDNFTIRVELPGLKREDIDVSLQDGALVISGERKTENSRGRHRSSPAGTLLRKILPRAHAADRRVRRQGESRLQGRHADRDAAQGRGSQAETNHRQRINFAR